MASSASDRSWNSTKANPRGVPVSRSMGSAREARGPMAVQVCPQFWLGHVIRQVAHKQAHRYARLLLGEGGMLAPPCSAGPAPYTCDAARRGPRAEPWRLGWSLLLPASPHGAVAPAHARVHHAVRRAVLAECVRRRGGRQSTNT